MSVFRLSAAVATAAPDTGGLLLATTRGPSTWQPVNRPDTDTTEKMDSETYILQHGHYQIEVMANLDKVPATGALIVVSWPKVENGLGFPARAFAILP